MTIVIALRRVLTCALFSSDLFPGKYYLKAILKEYTFESANKEVTVNEGKHIFSFEINSVQSMFFELKCVA